MNARQFSTSQRSPETFLLLLLLLLPGTKAAGTVPATVSKAGPAGWLRQRGAQRATFAA
jgi:hypothetical protein